MADREDSHAAAPERMSRHPARSTNGANHPGIGTPAATSVSPERLPEATHPLRWRE